MSWTGGVDGENWTYFMVETKRVYCWMWVVRQREESRFWLERLKE